MASGFFNVGVTGLNAAQMGLLTTGHNIANASTAGYNRQYIVQSNSTPVFTGSGFLGTGTGVETVRRVYSDFLATQVRSAETNVAELETYSNQIAQIDNLLADPSAGVSPALQDFFAAVADLSSTPNSVPARQALLSASQSMAARFQALDQQLTSMRDGVNSQIYTQVSTINSMVNQVAEINQRIIIAQAAGPGQPANDLYDQRDQLISELNKEIRVNVQVESDGSYSLFFGSGQPLVVGVQTYQLKAQAAEEDLTRIEIALTSPNGQTISLPESLISGGKLGGLLEFRSATLDEAQNSLGRVAMAIAQTINRQHQLGQDLQGIPGGNFFDDLQPSALGAPSNTGSGQVTASVIQSDYRLEFDGSQYAVIRLSDNTRTTYQSVPIVVDGIKLSLSGGSFAGTATNPDVFLIRPSAPPAERVSALAGNLGSAVVSSSGSNLQTMTVSDYRLEMVGTNQLTLTRISDGESWTGVGATQQDALDDVLQQAAPQGFDIDISGTMDVGDSFLIHPTRYAARDLVVAISDPRAIATGMAVRTREADTNGGSGAISDGEVVDTNTPLAAPFKLRYEASSNSLVGFPPGSRVMVGTQAFDISGTDTRVPFTSGTSYSIAGKAFSITGTPNEGDVFVIDVRDNGSSTPSTLGSLMGLPTTSSGTPVTVTGSIVLPTSITVPVGGISFQIAVDGTDPVTVTLGAGTYTPATLATAMQVAINAATAALPVPPAAVTVTVNASGQMQVSSGLAGVGSAIVANEATVTSAAVLAPAFVTESTSLPVKDITLTYRQADAASSLPARLEGFPAGSRVILTEPDGTVREFLMDPTDATADYVDFVANSTIEFNGVRFDVSGVPAEGDRFFVGPNPAGTGDARNLLALSALQQTNTMGDGTASFQSSYAQMVSQIGNKARELDVTLTAQENLVTQGTNAMQSASGVNLDEEAANLLRYQQAYQAAAKMMNLASSLFDEILAIAR
ncbi:MAG: flagellar hook-associated protein FlgK [Pseudomonadota bacterium]